MKILIWNSLPANNDTFKILATLILIYSLPVTFVWFYSFSDKPFSFQVILYNTSEIAFIYKSVCDWNVVIIVELIL